MCLLQLAKRLRCSTRIRILGISLLPLLPSKHSYVSVFTAATPFVSIHPHAIVRFQQCSYTNIFCRSSLCTRLSAVHSNGRAADRHHCVCALKNVFHHRNRIHTERKRYKRKTERIKRERKREKFYRLIFVSETHICCSTVHMFHHTQSQLRTAVTPTRSSSRTWNTPHERETNTQTCTIAISFVTASTGIGYTNTYLLRWYNESIQLYAVHKHIHDYWTVTTYGKSVSYDFLLYALCCHSFRCRLFCGCKLTTNGIIWSLSLH